MDYCLAVFASLNQINKLKKRLNRGGEYYDLMHAPKCVSTGGCSFALRFEESRLSRIKETAAELGIKTEALYHEQLENGSKVYIRIENGKALRL